ncbi:Gfo/Idh/MocA family protein [Oceanobacillus halotolerans]|uniref:Gfo/Idh/MocA family protein n=1 Tax=Oceanobacillus halotolerans TaxID=2663380 RepID=UPI0013DA4764|nr:Gfo/Idh/MocA family oxidoreductase [Oceanobacillus halotolerans]
MKFSTIGTSWITEAFLAAASNLSDVQLYSVYSRSEETAKQFAQKNGADEWYTNIDDMLEGESDFIYIASPNSMHYKHIIKCMEKKKHVFCEKPLVYNEKQWRLIKEKASEHGVFVFEGYRHLFSPNYMHLKNTLPKIGEIRSVLFQFVQYSSRYDAFKEGKEPNVFSKQFAGGALMDLGVYPLSMAIDLFGEPMDVDYFPVLLENGIDGSGTLVLIYQGFTVTIMCSKIAQATIPSEVQAEEGTLTVDHIAPIQHLEWFDRKTKETHEIAEKQHQEDMVYELEAFIRMIKEQDHSSHEQWLERSRQVVKWAEIARRKQGIIFPEED